MTKQELAALLNGNEIGNEVPDELARAARTSNLLIVFGASDDLCEFDGAFREEASCCDGGEILFAKDGKIPDMHEVQSALRILRDELGEGIRLPDLLKIEAIWDEKAPDGRECSWHYKTDLPHATFDIMEDGELYCIGMVIDLSEI